ncbi:hypothetical protein K438DRAFT_1771641 [Mycena galopus ATCC 62051]|nr:hypothetical protein K438DRAFT_1771641 [Mycena galopus ATCC 62051]
MERLEGRKIRRNDVMGEICPPRPSLGRRRREDQPRAASVALCQGDGDRGAGAEEDYRPIILAGLESQACARMATNLKPTNMKRSEMVPDGRAGRDHYWCLPPVRDTPAREREVPIGCIWTVAKAMLQNYPGGAVRAHENMESCIAEWQEHCALGVHPHPADPATLAQMQIPDVSALSLAEELRPAASSSTVMSTVSSVSTTPAASLKKWTDVPDTRYFALWGERIVYSDRGEARNAFLEAEEEGRKPRIMSSSEYDEAQAFAEGVYWV